LQIFRAALRAADPRRAVLSKLKFDGRTLVCGRQRYRMADFDRVLVVGGGKASAGMAAAVESLLGARVADGVVVVPGGVRARLRRIRLEEARHPIPDGRGVAGARAIARMARGAGERDLVIAVISGGASALLPLPVSGVSLREKQRITQDLLRAGAAIQEMNTVRKHLSGIKGGHLAALAHPASVLALILSDVIGDDLHVIGSGPAVADPTTVEDARAVLARRGVSIPRGVLRETPKPGDARLMRAANVIVGSNRMAIGAAAAKARELGYRTRVLSTEVRGEAREVAAEHAAIVRRMLARRRRGETAMCLLSGGETTVTVRGSGRGGRNLEYVLAAAIAIEGARGVTVFSGGTDGIDGPTDAAGAIADERTLVRAARAGVDPEALLANNDSYTFFEAVDGLVKTGPTGTNVMDVRVMLVG
jgi:hydroxypyruvate reductase